MTPLKHAKLVRLWLLAAVLCVAAMVLIGGVTRLTESGLSIVEWKLVSGIMPPMSDAAWQDEFAQYQTSPEYKIKNSSFTVEQFKRIYWLEYIHRLLGRFTGLVLIVPFVYFLAVRAFPARLTRRMLGACLLVAAQGVVGWVMVASGLVHDPRVNPVKLALHLVLALSLFSLLLWTYWQVRDRERLQVSRCFANLSRAMFVLLVLQIVLGALVAGNHAGLVYNTYPLMDGRLVPNGLWMLSPGYDNLVRNVVFVQFAHRVVAHVVLALALIAVVWGWRKQLALRAPLALLSLAVFGQFALGVSTLLHAVPVALGSAHQMGALVLLAATLNLLYRASAQQRI